ncbi:MAG: hypothetical protein SGPRY_010699 [Prymnesium sp.]
MLREKVIRQQGHTAYMAEQNAQLKREKLALQKEFDDYRAQRTHTPTARRSSTHRADLRVRVPSPPPTDSLSVAREVEALDLEVAAEVAAAVSPLRREGKGEGHKSRLHAELQVKLLSRAEELRRCKPGDEARTSRFFRLKSHLAPSASASGRLRSQFELCRSNLHTPELQLRLFYGAPRKELEAVLSSGFAEVPSSSLGLEVYGRGWYASHAHHYNGGDMCVLLVQVAVGNAETIVRRDAARGAPSRGYDSIVVPGRQLPLQLAPAQGKKNGWSPDNDHYRSPVNEEYVIFDGSQALPLYILEYEIPNAGIEDQP